MKFRKFSFHPIPAVVGLSVAALIAWALSHWTELPFWGAFAIVVGSMFINGVIAQFEDDAPGGFNNPSSDLEARAKSSNDSKKTPNEPPEPTPPAGAAHL